MFQSLMQPFFDMVRRKTAESMLAGVHDAVTAMSNDAKPEPAAIPQGVTLLLEGPKPARKGGR